MAALPAVPKKRFYASTACFIAPKYAPYSKRYVEHQYTSISTLCAVHLQNADAPVPPARGLLLQVSVANPLDRSSLSCSLAGGLHLAGEHCVLTSAVSLQQHQHEERNRLRSGVIHRLLLVPHKSGKIPRQSHAYRHHHLCKAHGIREKP